jgi:hypothetical protein
MSARFLVSADRNQNKPSLSADAEDGIPPLNHVQIGLWNWFLDSFASKAPTDPIPTADQPPAMASRAC